jgi:hypothetical protein
LGHNFKTGFLDFKDAKDTSLKAYLAIATSLPTRNPWLAPRNDKFFKRQIKKRWPAGVIAAASGENKTEQRWVVRQRHQRFVHCRVIKWQGSQGQRFAAWGSVLFCGVKACGQRGICDDGSAFWLLLAQQK